MGLAYVRSALFFISMLVCAAAQAQLQTHEELSSLLTSTGTLYGTLLLPDPAPQAVVVIHAGSGPTDRDGNTPQTGKNDGLKQLAQALAMRGIGSLRYDKRGIGASRAAISGEPNLSIDTYADDLAAWARQLRRDPRFSTIILAGHSEGSLIGMLAAQQVPIDGFISLAGPSQRASQVLRAQLRPQLTDGQFAQLDQSLREIEAGHSPHTPPTTPPFLANLFRPDLSPYLISWIRRNPAEEIARLSGPVLIVQGTLDERLSSVAASELKRAQPNATLMMIAGMHHTLKEAPATPEGQISAWSDPTTLLSPRLVETMVEFVRAIPALTKQ